MSAVAPKAQHRPELEGVRGRVSLARSPVPISDATYVHLATQRLEDNITSITPGALKGGLIALDRNPKSNDLLVGGVRSSIRRARRRVVAARLRRRVVALLVAEGVLPDLELLHVRLGRIVRGRSRLRIGRRDLLEKADPADFACELAQVGEQLVEAGIIAPGKRFRVPDRCIGAGGH